MGKIRVLPEGMINRIAAGEVVERPASVVKELLENSLDAGAGSVEVRLEEGGRRLIEVADDGCGMEPADAAAALQRHATSKLDEGSVLSRIETLGFRGEALPSIAAVGRLHLVTSDGRQATQIRVEGGRIAESGPAARARGTTVTVRDLFFNMPARRRFLRTPSTELSHIVESFVSLALARPQLRFRLDHGRRRLFDLPSAGEVRLRLVQIEGSEAARAAVPLAAGRGGVRVSGFILGGGGRRRRLLVNGRAVRDRLLAAAVNRALESFLPAGSSASCVLVLEVPAEEVDVNVHPAKTEVRFAAPGRIHDLVYEAIGMALREGSRPPHVAGEDSDGPSAGGPPFAGTVAAARHGIEAAAASYLRRHDPGTDWRATLPQGEVAERAGPTRDLVVLGRYRNGYILADDGDGLVMVDQHAAHERVLFEELIRSEGEGGTPVQSLLFSRTVTAPAALRGRCGEIAGELTALGFDIEEFGEGTLLVRGVPAPLAHSDPEALVLELLSGYEDPELRSQGVEGRRRRILSTAACHAAVKVTSPLPEEKISWILGALLQCRAPLKCPHGRPTILRWDHRSLERRFGRP